jgi:ABC-type sugar transport system substrate-binding protein
MKKTVKFSKGISMKKVFSVLVILLFAVFCVFGEPKKQTGGAKDTIAFSNLFYGNYFFFVEVESVKRGAEELGYKFVTANANVDSAVQASQYQTYIDQGVKAIVADAVDSDALVDFVNRAHNAGIYTAMVDTPVSGGHVDVSVVFDNFKGGQMAGERIIELLTKKYGTPKGKVLNVHGRMEGLASRLRSEGFEAAIKKYPNVQLVRSLSTADGDAHDAVANQMAVHNDIDAIFVYSDGHLYGTTEALKKYNRWAKSGDPRHMIVVSLDGAYDTLQYIRDDWTDGVIAQDASSYGLIAMELLGKYSFKGQSVPLGPYSNPKFYWEKCEIINSPSGPLVSVPPYIIDKTNVDDPRHWANVGVKEWGLKPNM